MEVGIVVYKDDTEVLWHLPPNRTGGTLPDSRDLWDVLWEGRKTIQGVGHSHPGGGIPGPSYTDVTTFAAVEAALGVRLDWWITSETHLIVARWSGPNRLDYTGTLVEDEPSWADELRQKSGQQMKMKEREATSGN